MKKILVIIIFLVLGFSFTLTSLFKITNNQGAPPYDVSFNDDLDINRFSWLKNWKRPDGPPKVGLQVGHWKNDELPDELAKLKGSTGSKGGGKSEWEVNLAIAEQTKKLLEEKEVAVDILPATVTQEYWADVFVSIHADGSTEPGKSGFKAASPRRDFSGNANKLLMFIEEEYAQVTNLAKDPNVTRNMRGYYAFAWWRYDHAVHPMTSSVILETGFLTSPSDRRLIVNQPEVAAAGIASGIINFLTNEGLLT